MCVTIEPGVYLVPNFWQREDLVAPVADLINRELWWVRWLAGFFALFPLQVAVRLYERLWLHANLAWWELFSQPFITARKRG